jgi:hypothetical protein
MARHLGALAGLAAGVVVGSLVLGQVVSGRDAGRGALIALFMVLLIGTFALLAAAVVDSEHGVEQISASPRWSLRAAIRRLARRVLAAIGRLVRRVATIVHALLRHLMGAARAGITRLRESLTPQNRKEKWNALKQAGRATLVALGLPPDEEARKLPNEGLDAMPTLPRERSRPSEESHHPRRSDVEPFRRTFGPERRRAARDSLAHHR